MTPDRRRATDRIPSPDRGQAADPGPDQGARFRKTLWRVLLVQAAALLLLWLLQATYHT